MTSSTSTPLKAVVYVRLSRHRGESDPSTSPARQREACEAYCAAKGWDVVEVVEDLDVSGSDKGLRLDRPGLKRVREMLPGVDVVIFSKLDRLARNTLDFQTFADEAARHDVALVSVAESLDLTTPSGRFVSTILSSFAELEAATIAERTRAGLRATVKLGRYVGGEPPFGYRAVANPDGPGKVLAIDPDEAETVRMMVENVLAGHSLYSIAEALNAAGRATPKGAKGWSMTAVRRVLLSPAIRGHVSHLGDVLRDDEGLPEKLLPAIITDAEGLTVDALVKPKPAAPRRRRAARLLSGVAVCAACGGPLMVGQSNGKATYRCQGKQQRGCTAPASVRADWLDEHVEDAFLAAVGWLPVVETRLVETGSAELAMVESALAETTDALRDPDAELDVLLERLTALRARRDALVAAGTTPEVETVATGQTFAEAWQERDLVGRRDLLRSALSAVALSQGRRGRAQQGRVDPRRVELIWRP